MEGDNLAQIQANPDETTVNNDADESSANSSEAVAVDYGVFAPAVYGVLKRVHPDLEITRNAMSIMNSMMMDILGRIALEMDKISAENPSQPFSAREVDLWAKANLPGALAQHGMLEGRKSVHHYGLINGSEQDVSEEEYPDSDEEDPMEALLEAQIRLHLDEKEDDL